MEIVREGKDFMELKFSEQYTLPLFLKKYLEKAGARAVAHRVPHPEVQESFVFFRADDPRDTLKKALKLMKQDLKEFLQEFEGAWKG